MHQARPAAIWCLYGTCITVGGCDHEFTQAASMVPPPSPLTTHHAHLIHAVQPAQARPMSCSTTRALPDVPAEQPATRSRAAAVSAPPLPATM